MLGMYAAVFFGCLLGQLLQLVLPPIAKRLYWRCTCKGESVELICETDGSHYDRCCRCRKPVERY